MTSGTSTMPSDGAVDPAEIAQLPQRMIEAWAAHDADRFADLFVEDGTLILPGRFQQGREAVRAFMAAAFQGVYQGTRVTGKPIAIKPLGPGAVALITEGGVIPAGAEELPASAAIRASWILVRQEEGWRLALYQNCPR